MKGYQQGQSLEQNAPPPPIFDTGALKIQIKFMKKKSKCIFTCKSQFHAHVFKYKFENNIFPLLSIWKSYSHSMLILKLQAFFLYVCKDVENKSKVLT